MLRRGMQLALERHGHEVRVTADGESALRLAREHHPELVVLDVMLPGFDGFDVCRRLRSVSDVPIIMVTARDDDFDVLGGLAAGADDYVIKPVQPMVLDARIRAVLRRVDPGHDGVREHGGLRIDTESLTVALRGEPLALTPTELRLLLMLSASPGRVFSRQQLLASVWEQQYLGDSRLVDNCVQRLRAKVEEDPGSPRYIETVRGFGYRFGAS